ncbi:homeobox-domain-containing protein [Gymnopus androsaceus JB14]|uniref:Homeobox-domain-containing protein n=1 Tax=Gymnopus androsaceus JB14 TaxID=1447944 RepID=A0A6A4HXX3_9AGAR|nr:homeobox-domain-containing protein [Gymnopus androsaceus JB14]
MAKRFRVESMSGRQSDRSSPSSDSQGGMADTEDGERSNLSGRSPAPSEPPKKKRTRTLTTPHQSSVLHALLAQSRFPTTAMREEVGRAIGLSARKVQIWFQNQRQKARRPRTHNEMQTTRPPQYGPFPSAGDTEILNLYPRSQQGVTQPEFYNPGVHPSHPPAYAIPPSLPSGLLGPGVPGHGTSRRMPESLSPVSPVGASSSRVTRRDFVRRSPSPLRIYNPEHPRPATSDSSAPIIPYRDASRTLPPLVFPPRQGSSAGLLSIRSAPANMPPPSPFQRTRSPQFSFSPPSAEPGSRSALPPPFTLEPQPQWNDPIFTSVPRTGSSTWSHHSSERSGSISPTVSRAINPLRGSLENEQTSREGRYDPVRSIVVPYDLPESPSASDQPKE